MLSSLNFQMQKKTNCKNGAMNLEEEAEKQIKGRNREYSSSQKQTEAFNHINFKKQIRKNNNHKLKDARIKVWILIEYY